MDKDELSPDDVLGLWFPDTGHWNDPQSHAAFFTERMQGGMDATISDRFAALTLAGATGRLDHWAGTARGRLALLIVLDQFPRSLWRDTPAAYAQDIKATRLALEGIANGHFDGLEVWEQTFYVIAIQHCEGPDHLERLNGLDDVLDGIVGRIPGHMSQMGDFLQAQHVRVKSVIARFGRHAHRNEILGRASTPDEAAYIARGDFPHNSPGEPESKA